MKKHPPTALAPLLQQFFVERLQKQRQASPCTISSYRDTFRLFLTFVESKLHKRPAALSIDVVSTHLALDFLDHLEQHRKNCARSRNARFAAIRSFIQFVGFKEPAALALTHGMLGIPMKRFDRHRSAFSAASTLKPSWLPRTSRPGPGVAIECSLPPHYNTGARVSELIGATVEDLNLAGSPSLRLQVKGRKERSIPLWTADGVPICLKKQK